MPRSVLSLLFVCCAAVVAFACWPHPWERGAWDAADHNGDGVLTRAEMRRFSTQKPHRNAGRLMMHFDHADTDANGVVSDDEIAVYGTQIGSKDPMDHLPR